MNAGAKVLTIRPGTPFLDALAAGILHEAGDDPLALADMTILLPTRRACRAIREAFLRAGDGKPLLFPAMRPISHIVWAELLLVPAPDAGFHDDPELTGRA